MENELALAIRNNNRWYKNCKNVRKRGGLICKVCPFVKVIEQAEKIEKKRKEQLHLDIADQTGWIK
jgi:DNA modification methylase